MSTKRCTFRACSSSLMLSGAIASVSTFGLPGAARAAPSAVDVAQARELLNMGLELRGKGDVAASLEKLKAAYALVRTPITGLELGRTYMMVGNLVEARETFLSNARIAERSEETARSKAARKESEELAEQLRTRIPSLSVKITGVPSDTVAVTIDGASVPNEALAAPRLVDPGSHTVVARSTTGGVAETTVELKEGETRDVELKIAFTGGSAQAPPGLARGPASPAASHSVVFDAHAGETASHGSSHVLEWALLGAGVALGAAGAVIMVVEANNASDAANRLDRSTYDSSGAAWTAGLITTIVGGAAVAAGGVMLLTSTGDSGQRGARPSVWVGVGPGAVRLGGTW